MLCLTHPCLSAADLPEGCWVCPCCSQPNTLPVGPTLSRPTACPLNRSPTYHCRCLADVRRTCAHDHGGTSCCASLLTPCSRQEHVKQAKRLSLLTTSAAQAEEEDPDAKAKELLKMERMGLTPDWIIQVGSLIMSPACGQGVSSNDAARYC